MSLKSVLILESDTLPPNTILLYKYITLGEFFYFYEFSIISFFFYTGPPEQLVLLNFQ